MAELAQKISKSTQDSPSLAEGVRGWVDLRKSAPKFTQDSRESCADSPKTCKFGRESKRESKFDSRESTKESWFERDECAGSFWLNLTILLVRILPKFALNIVIFVVTAIYYAFSKKERTNLAKFYKLAQDYCNKNAIFLQGNAKKYINNPNIYLNFYHFGWAICDKILAWMGKIRYDDISINHESIIKNLCKQKKGRILLMSHFGNAEVAFALSQKFRNLRIVIFVYQKNTEKFLQMIDKISGQKIDRIYVDEIDIKRLLDLREIIENGGHIGIMGDRIALNNKRNVEMKFLGKNCYFSLGAFIIAKLLEAQISMMWCEKIDGKYRVEIENISESSDDFSASNLGESTPSNPKNRRDKIANLKPLLQKYVRSLETHTINNPTQWFSFYDFWESPRDFKARNLGDLDSNDANLKCDFSDLGANL